MCGLLRLALHMHECCTTLQAVAGAVRSNTHVEALAAVGTPGRPDETSCMAVLQMPNMRVLVHISQSCIAVLTCWLGSAGAAQAEALKMNRPLLSVGTPGRLAEMSRMGVLQTHSTRILVLDEVCIFIALLLVLEIAR